MQTIYASTLARDLMNEHGLADWTFEFDRAKSRAGACHYRKKKITLSWHHVILNDVEEVRDTILHEIAHALAGPQAGHGWQWKAVCRRIGAKPRRCFTREQVNMPQGRYTATCKGCGKTFSKHRRVRRKYHCTSCGPDRGALNFALAA